MRSDYTGMMNDCCPRCNVKYVQDQSNGTNYCPDCWMTEDGQMYDPTGPTHNERKGDRGAYERRIKGLLRKYKTAPAIERNLKPATVMIENIGPRMGINDPICEHAAALYEKALRKNLIRGRSLKCFVAASLYIACRLKNVPRTLDEFAAICEISSSDISHTSKFMARRLRIKMVPPGPEYYVDKFCFDLDLSQKVITGAKQISAGAGTIGSAAGRDPRGIAAAAIYISSHIYRERRTQKEISKATGVSENTIRSRYVELKEMLGISIHDSCIRIKTDADQRTSKTQPPQGSKDDGRPRCTECGSTEIYYDYDRLEMVCNKCGYVKDLI